MTLRLPRVSNPEITATITKAICRSLHAPLTSSNSTLSSSFNSHCLPLTPIRHYLLIHLQSHSFSLNLLFYFSLVYFRSDSIKIFMIFRFLFVRDLCEFCSIYFSSFSSFSPFYFHLQSFPNLLFLFLRWFLFHLYPERCSFYILHTDESSCSGFYSFALVISLVAAAPAD